MSIFILFELAKFIIMQKYKKPKFSEEDLGTNPCAIPLEIPVHEMLFKNQFIKDGGLLLPLIREVEKTPFVRLYTTSQRRKILSKCSPQAKSLFLWILFEIEYGKDYLWINKDRYMEENYVSLATYRRSIKELHRYNLIQPSVKKGIYWINPDFVFKGNRVEKYPNKVKVE